MDSFIVIVVVGLMIGLLVVMFKYANFIHNFPKQHDEQDARENPEVNENDDPSNTNQV